MKLINQMSIRRQNLNRIVDILGANKAVTRQEIASQTGLSLMSVSNLIDILLSQGVLDIMLSKNPSGSIGRPAERISLSNSRHSLVVLDLTTLSFRCDFVSLNGSFQGSSHALQHDQQLSYLENLELFLGGVKRGIEQSQREILGIAVAVPGPYNVANDRVINKRITALGDLSIKTVITKNLGNQRVFVDEDVKFAVQAHLDLVPRGSGKLMYYLFLGEGVGGAIVNDGIVLRGLNAMAGDSGQLHIGKADTIEQRTSTQAFLQLLGFDQPGNDDVQGIIMAVKSGNPALYDQALRVLAGEISHLLKALAWILDPHDVTIDCNYLCDEDMNKLMELIMMELNASAWDKAVQLPNLHMTSGSFSIISSGAARTLRDIWIRDISIPPGNGGTHTAPSVVTVL